jgi:hypothetical protein
MALTSAPLCKAPAPSDTKYHRLYHECPATKEYRQDPHSALCITWCRGQ